MQINKNYDISKIVQYRDIYLCLLNLFNLKYIGNFDKLVTIVYSKFYALVHIKILLFLFYVGIYNGVTFKSLLKLLNIFIIIPLIGQIPNIS